jgi:RNA polymerase sigma-70 factor, ECF subfamily
MEMPADTDVESAAGTAKLKRTPLKIRRPPALPDVRELASLVQRVGGGDQSAEGIVVDLFHEAVRLVALGRTGKPEVARELAQDVLMATIVALRRGGLREYEKLTAFVYGIARNHINNYFRANARQPDEEVLSPQYPGEAAADPVESAERAALVRRALAALSSSDRKILLLTLVDGLKPGEIARRLGLSHEVVRARKSRAIKKIVEYLSKLSRTDAIDHLVDR